MPCFGCLLSRRSMQGYAQHSQDTSRQEAALHTQRGESADAPQVQPPSGSGHQLRGAVSELRQALAAKDLDAINAAAAQIASVSQQHLARQRRQSAAEAGTSWQPPTAQRHQGGSQWAGDSRQGTGSQWANTGRSRTRGWEGLPGAAVQTPDWDLQEAPHYEERHRCVLPALVRAAIACKLCCDTAQTCCHLKCS